MYVCEFYITEFQELMNGVASVMDATHVVPMKKIFKSASWLLCSLVMNLLLIRGSQS